MEIEKYLNKVRYTLSNENLEVGDQVFPIGRGRIREDGKFILHNLDFTDYMSGFPDEPHTILDLNHSGYKPYEVRTDHGYSPKESFFKIIKKEKHIVEWSKKDGCKFKTINKWAEITD